MELGINLRHQNGAEWDEVLEAVRTAEELGFALVTFPDHYVAVEHVVRPDGTRATADIRSPTGPSDCWTLIAALAPQTSTLRFATMMTSSTFRHPGPLAVAVAQVNRITGGRIDLGVGTNWHEGEHLAFGVPYPGRSRRFDRLDEYLAVITALWDTPPGETFDLDGDYFTVRSGEGIPRPPGLARPRVIVGGSGLERTPLVAGRFADECNTLARTPEAAAPFFAACAAAFEAAGRDPALMRRSHLLTVLCAEDEADARRQAEAAGVTLEQLPPGRVATPDELVERLLGWQAAGVDRVVISRNGGVDLPSLRMIGELVVPRVIG
ncbi:MAG TPA: LLM class flavin-dependent oxidoreductase [Acidimicrobiales bacterium]|nr:LLM class flavin-dependent oxidoreductase [Acidimicrobiales bacterium]